MEENSQRLGEIFDHKYGAFIQRAENDFEIECKPSVEERQLYYLEECEVKVDNLKVNRRRTLFEKM